MNQYHEKFLEDHFDEHDFFHPEHRDKRSREVWLRTKKCLEEKAAFDQFSLHPANWAAKSNERFHKNKTYLDT